MTEDLQQRIRHIYERFNARDIDGVLALLGDNVAWANAMEGGYVHGHEAVRAYWTRQWAIVSPFVQPVAFSRMGEGVITVEVIQTVFDLEGRPLHNQDHGLKDKTVLHVFRLEDGRIVRFDVEEVG